MPGSYSTNLRERVLAAVEAEEPADAVAARFMVGRSSVCIVETASRIRIAFAAAHPEAVLFANLARCLQPAGP